MSPRTYPFLVRLVPLLFLVAVEASVLGGLNYVGSPVPYLEKPTPLGAELNEVVLPGWPWTAKSLGAEEVVRYAETANGECIGERAPSERWDARFVLADGLFAFGILGATVLLARAGSGKRSTYDSKRPFESDVVRISFSSAGATAIHFVLLLASMLAVCALVGAPHHFWWIQGSHTPMAPLLGAFLGTWVLATQRRTFSDGDDPPASNLVGAALLPFVFGFSEALRRSYADARNVGVLWGDLRVSNAARFVADHLSAALVPAVVGALQSATLLLFVAWLFIRVAPPSARPRRLSMIIFVAGAIAAVAHVVSRQHPGAVDWACALVVPVGCWLIVRAPPGGPAARVVLLLSLASIVFFAVGVRALSHAALLDTMTGESIDPAQLVRIAGASQAMARRQAFLGIGDALVLVLTAIIASRNRVRDGTTEAERLFRIAGVGCMALPLLSMALFWVGATREMAMLGAGFERLGGRPFSGSQWTPDAPVLRDLAGAAFSIDRTGALRTTLQWNVPPAPYRPAPASETSVTRLDSTSWPLLLADRGGTLGTLVRALEPLSPHAKVRWILGDVTARPELGEYAPFVLAQEFRTANVEIDPDFEISNDPDAAGSRESVGLLVDGANDRLVPLARTTRGYRLERREWPSSLDELARLLCRERAGTRDREGERGSSDPRPILDVVVIALTPDSTVDSVVRAIARAAVDARCSGESSALFDHVVVTPRRDELERAAQEVRR